MAVRNSAEYQDGAEQDEAQSSSPRPSAAEPSKSSRTITDCYDPESMTRTTATGPSSPAGSSSDGNTSCDPPGPVMDAYDPVSMSRIKISAKNFGSKVAELWAASSSASRNGDYAAENSWDEEVVTLPPSSPAHTFKEKHTRRAVFFVFVAAAVITTVGITVSAHQKRSHTPTATTQAGEGIIVDGTVQDIWHWCNNDAIRTEEGYDQCKRACNQRKCCFIPAGNPESCDDCKEVIDACEILTDDDGNDVESKIPPAPYYIDDICSLDLLSTAGFTADGAFKECKEACKAGMCCHGADADEKVDDCYDANIDVCQGYKACSILGLGPKGDPDEVKKFCRPELVMTEKGRAACEKVCDSMSCCFLTDAFSCNNAHDTICKTYIDSCALLSQDSEPSNKIPRPPAILGEVCSDGYMWSSTDFYEAFEECEKACLPGRCCYPNEGELDCYKDNLDACAEYRPCFVLGWASKNENDVAGEPLEDINSSGDKICSVSSLETDVGWASCKAKCKDRLCCFRPESDYRSCVKDLPQECEEDSDCRLFFEVAGDIRPGDNNEGAAGIGGGDDAESAHEIIKKACSEESIAKSDFCEQYCEPYMCCFAAPGDGNCIYESADDCDIHQPCAVLLAEKDDENKSDAEELAQLHALLLGACKEDALAGGSKMCEKLCQMENIACCFSAESSKSCALTQPDICVAYSPCEVLSLEGGDDTTNKDQAELQEELALLSVACREDVIKSGSKMCSSMCADYMCCFASSDNCALSQSQECAARLPCEILTIIDHDQSDTAVNSVDFDELARTHDILLEACKRENLKAGRNTCSKLCDKEGVECCFTNDDVDSCTLTSPDLCMAYAPCEVLKFLDHKDDKGGSNEIEATNKELNEKEAFLTVACKEAAIGAGSKICQEMCQDFTCCFSPDPERICGREKASQCSVYSPCKVMKTLGLLETDDSNPADVYSRLSRACHEDVIKFGNTQCERECQDYLCCFNEGIDSCTSTSPDECVTHAPCEILTTMIKADDEVHTDDFAKEADEFAIIAIACKEDMINTGSTICAEMCDDHMCCIDGSCSLPECPAYSPCKALGATGQKKHGSEIGSSAPASTTEVEVEEHASTYATLAKACKKDVLEFGITKCIDECQDYLCCFQEGEDNCALARPNDCTSHWPCEILVTGIEDQPNGNGEDDRSEFSDEFTILLVACKESVIRGGSTICKEMCEDHMCCLDGSCKTLKPNECAAFSPCKALVETGHQGRDNEAKDEGGACSAINVATPSGYVQCQSMCMRHDTLKACEVLQYAGPMFVDKACTDQSIATPIGQAYCTAICSQASCCTDATRGREENCYEDKPLFCDQFEACEVLGQVRA